MCPTALAPATGDRAVIGVLHLSFAGVTFVMLSRVHADSLLVVEIVILVALGVAWFMTGTTLLNPGAA